MTERTVSDERIASIQTMLDEWTTNGITQNWKRRVAELLTAIEERDAEIERLKQELNSIGDAWNDAGGQL